MADTDSDTDESRSATAVGAGAPSSAPKKKERSKVRSGIAAAGKSLNESSVQSLRDLAAQAAERSVPSYKRGGTTKRKQVARLHRGETISKAKRGRKRGRM